MTIKRAGLLLLLLAMIAVACIAFWWQPFLIHASQVTGTSSSASRSYNWWSGFGTLVLQALDPTVLAGIGIYYWHHTCHERTCLRLAHPTPNGYQLCKIHVGKSVAELDLHEIHPDHQTTGMQ